jgi:hypothetical protein
LGFFCFYQNPAYIWSMEMAKQISEMLGSGIYPNVEVEIGYFQDENGKVLRNSKLNGYIYEIDIDTNYCKVMITDSNLIINVNSIKLI